MEESHKPGGDHTPRTHTTQSLGPSRAITGLARQNPAMPETTQPQAFCDTPLPAEASKDLAPPNLLP